MCFETLDRFVRTCVRAATYQCALKHWPDLLGRASELHLPVRLNATLEGATTVHAVRIDTVEQCRQLRLLFAPETGHTVRIGTVEGAERGHAVRTSMY